MNLRKTILAGAIALTMGHFANAAVVLTDSFVYTDGNLVGQGGWTQTGATATNPVAVTSEKAVLGTSGQDIYKAFSSSVPKTDGNTLYTGFTLNVQTAQATGDYFLHLSDPVGTTSNFYERVFAKSSGSGFLLGISPTTGTGTYGGTELAFNTDYRVVVAWNFVTGALNDTFSLYVNPADTGIEANNTAYATVAWSGAVAEPAQITAGNLRQGTASNAPAAKVDDLNVATTFSEAAVAVPEPATFGLATLALLPLRRRR